jgi:hypothetical protein
MCSPFAGHADPCKGSAPAHGHSLEVYTCTQRTRLQTCFPEVAACCTGGGSLNLLSWLLPRGKGEAELVVAAHRYGTFGGWDTGTASGLQCLGEGLQNDAVACSLPSSLVAEPW